MSNQSGFVIEEASEGRSLVVTGPWSDSAARLVSSGAVDGLVLNYARGFAEASLNLLERDWALRSLTVLDRTITDLDPLRRLQNLEHLYIEASSNAELDLEPLRCLRSVVGPWPLVGRALGSVERLERVTTWMFTEPDLHSFRDHFRLKSLTIKDAQYLEALSGIDTIPALEKLVVVGAPLLHDISDIVFLAASLRELELEECPRITSLDPVRGLLNLRFLGISESGEIDSLRPLEPLGQLETFYAWGTTRVVDDDLSPLTRLPKLREIRMRNRRGYKPSLRDLPAAVE